MARESEKETRAQRIDPKLRSANWRIAKFTSEVQARQLTATAVEEYPTASGPADYALMDGGTARAVVEAVAPSYPSPAQTTDQHRRPARIANGRRVPFSRSALASALDPHPPVGRAQCHSDCWDDGWPGRLDSERLVVS
jgi:type I site-specific restriction endonuclease